MFLDGCRRHRLAERHGDPSLTHVNVDDRTAGWRPDQLARYTVVLLSIDLAPADVTVSATGTSPGFGAPELIGTTTVIDRLAGRKSDGLIDGRELVNRSCRSGLALPGSDPSAAEKSTVSGPATDACMPDAGVRTSVTSSVLACWLMYGLGDLDLTRPERHAGRRLPSRVEEPLKSVRCSSGSTPSSRCFAVRGNAEWHAHGRDSIPRPRAGPIRIPDTVRLRSATGRGRVSRPANPRGSLHDRHVRGSIMNDCAAGEHQALSCA